MSSGYNPFRVHVIQSLTASHIRFPVFNDIDTPSLLERFGYVFRFNFFLPLSLSLLQPLIQYTVVYSSSQGRAAIPAGVFSALSKVNLKE